MESKFELTFQYLKQIEQSRVTHSLKTFELLKLLNKDSEKTLVDHLISELNSIQYYSNTTDYFYFYLPVIAHILYFKPEQEKEIFHYLIGPNFANGIETSKEMILSIQGAMQYKMKQNEHYLTQEGQIWVNKILPLMEKEVKREINQCIKDFEE